MENFRGDEYLARDDRDGGDGDEDQAIVDGAEDDDVIMESGEEEEADNDHQDNGEIGGDGGGGAQLDNGRYPAAGPRRRARLRERDNGHQQRRNRPRADGPRRIRYPQKYRFEWETHPEKQLWLRSCQNSEFDARCLLCNRRFRAMINVIEDHGRSGRHTVNLANHQAAGSPPLVDEEAPAPLTTLEFRTELARIQLMLTTGFAAAYVPFRFIDRLLPLIVNIARNFNVLRSVALCRTTMANIVKRIIAPVHHEQLRQLLLNQKFSILFDESTDLSRKKHGCVVIRFFNEDLRKTVSLVWKMSKVYNEDEAVNDATAVSLFNLIIRSFGDNQEELVRLQNNMIAFMSDGAATMIGIRNSVASRFRDLCPGITTLVCICHRLHLAAKAAFSELPENIQNLARDIYNLFRSPSKQHTLSQHQINLNRNVHEMLRPVPERWLSLGPALRRIQEQWDPLIATLRDHNEEELLERLEHPLSQCYLAFLNFIIPVMENMNGFFQREETLLPEVYSRVTEDIEDVFLCFLDEDYYRRVGILGVDLADEENFVDFDVLFIGDEARGLCDELEDVQMRDEFLTNCMSYYVRLAWEMMERLEVHWRPYRCAVALLQNNALSAAYHEENANVIQELAALFPRLIEGDNFIQTIQNQWNHLLRYPFENLALERNVRTDGFWHQISRVTDDDGEQPFAEIGRFFLNVSTIPHSNAETERAWSRERLAKPKLRNRLHVETLDALMGAIDCVNLQNCKDDIAAYQPNEEMIQRIMLKQYNPNRDNANRNNLAELMDEMLAGMMPEAMDVDEEENEEMNE